MDFFLDWLKQASVTWLLLWGIGVVAVRVLVPRSFGRDALLIAPFFGFSIISAVGHYLGSLSMPAQSFAWALGLLAVVALLGLAIQRKLEFKWRLHVPIIVVCILAYLVAIAPLIQLGYLTTVGSTIDGISYAVRSEYLREAGLVSPIIPPGHPFYGWAAFQINTLRVGDVYFMAVVLALTGARSYQLLTATSALFFALTSASVYFFSRRALCLRRNAALLAAALAGISNLILWSVWDNFLSQSIAMSLCPVLMVFGLRAIRTLRWRDTLCFALLFAALLSVYPTYAMPVGATSALYASLVLIRKMQVNSRRKLHVVRRYIVWAMSILGLMLAWNAVAVVRSLNEFSFITQLLDPGRAAAVGRGNIDTFPRVYEMAGLISHALEAYQQNVPVLPFAARTGLFAAMLLWIALGWWQLKRTRWEAGLIALVLVAFLLQQRFGMGPMGYPYGYFKIISLLTLFLLPLMAHGAMSLPKWRYIRHVTWGLLAAIVVVNGVNSFWTMRYVLDKRTIVTRKVIELAQGLKAIPPDEWIMLDVAPGLQQHWIGYLLRDHRISYVRPLFTQNVADHLYPPPFFQYALVERRIAAERAQQYPEEPWYHPAQHDVIWRNTAYDLERRTDGVAADTQTTAGQENWEAGQELRILTDLSAHRLQTQLGQRDSLQASLEAQPRALQVTLVVTRDGKLEAGGRPITLTPGVWGVQLALDDAGQVSLKNAGDTSFLLHRIRAFSTSLDHSPQIEQLAYGAALITQSLEENRLEYRLALLRPPGDEAVYRLGIHIVDTESPYLYGVWSVDLTDPKSFQRGTLAIDVAERTAEASVRAAYAAVEAGPQEVQAGTFEVQVVWWRWNWPTYLSLTLTAQFHRDQEGNIQWKSVSQPPLVILAAP